jgi:hypothetical protein
LGFTLHPEGIFLNSRTPDGEPYHGALPTLVLGGWRCGVIDRILLLSKTHLRGHNRKEVAIIRRYTLPFEIPKKN